MSQQLIQAYVEHFLSGNGFATIVQARQLAESVLGRAIAPGTAQAKQVDEAVEAAVVRVASVLIQRSQTTHEAYDRLVDLLQRQPNLSVRSSTSVLQQAYSTPIPIAYLASVLARITPETTVYEPTAGNGALLIAANPVRVIANELNGDRVSELKTRNYAQVTQQDTLIYRPQIQVDVVICNPPFGSILDANRRTRRFWIYDTWTTQIDQVIALNALQVMKYDGRAVLILGGKLGSDEELRSERYNTRESRAFYYLLYNHYNVTQHFSIWGDLYRKQGAGFPIDIVVIEGRRPSTLSLPAAEVPPIYQSFTDLKERLPDEPLRKLSPDLGTPLLSLPLRRESTRNRAEPGQKDVQSIDGAAAGLDDPALDGSSREQPAGHPTAAGDHPERTPSLSGVSPDQPGRPGSPHLANRMGGSLHPAQPPLQRSPAPDGNGRNRLSRDPPEFNSVGIRGTPHRPSGNLPGGMADLPPPLQLGLITNTSETGIMADSPSSEAPPNAYAQPRQVPYTPKSKGTSAGVLIPTNMASAAQVALDRFEQRHGDIDDYLATRLGYASTAELHQYLCAEQVDAIALAISNLERGAGFITGDQTGIGKGRICASIMRYAQQHGKVAIFVTKENTLYADMMRDVADIGMRRFHPFATDIDARIPLPNGGEIRTGRPAQQEREMLEMMRSQSSGHYSAIFSTYSQLQTVGKKEPLRRDFLRGIAPNAILILDEAHQAGGSQSGWQPSGPPNRAEFVRELIDLSAGTFYSSATYAKRPDVMDLYARRTDLRLGVSSMSALENILSRGGVPLQQIVASKFVASGQMLRRERSYEGVNFQAKVVPVDREVADEFSAAMRAIKDFDRAKQRALKELRKKLKEEAKQLGQDNAVGEVGAKSTNFTSLMHNCIEQGLLAQKAEATVQEAIQTLERGEKPVIALANTMGSFIEGYADLHDLKHGDPIDLSFAHLLERYLERSRDVLVIDYRGIRNRYRLTDAELGEVGVTSYEEALECIRDGDFSRIPISPIDYIKHRLEQSGYSVTEVTGREAGIDYAASGTMTYKVRPQQETTPKAKIDAVAQFNAGDRDVIILNCSGSTGISLHASEKFADQRPRHMIVAQAERDINVFMQMLGRIHRTGQVALPGYTLLMGDIPAEKRPGAILCGKMASLNANTTASRETDISINNVVDFMNAYGEQVVSEILNDDPELNASLDFPTAKAENDSSDIALIKKVTGAIPLLPIEQQEAVYDLIEAEYRDLVDQARAMGENILEADQLDLDARPLARMEVIPDESGIQSEFTGPVLLEVVDAKSQTKPLTQLQMINAVRDGLGLVAVKDVEEHDREAIAQLAKQRMTGAIAQLTTATNRYRDAIVSRKEEEAIAKFNEKLDKQLRQVTRVLEEYAPGTPVRLVTPTSKSIFYGVVAGIDPKTRSGSPSAPNSWKIRVLVADSARQIIVPLSKFNSGREGTVIANVQDKDWFGTDVYDLFDKQQETGRINRQIFTGNLIKAFEKYPTGKLINYSDNQGNVRQGLMMSKGFDIQEELTREAIAFKEPYQVMAFITDLTERRGAVKTLDELLILKAQRNGDGFVLQAPAAKESGGRYFLDEAIITAVGSDFYSVSDRMEVVIPPHRLEQTLNVLMNQRNYTLAAFDNKEIARDYLGIKLPKLQVLENFEPQRIEPSGQLQPIQQMLDVQESASATRTPINPLSNPPRAMETKSSHWRIVSPRQQKDGLGKRIARFLEEAGILQTVNEGEEFHLKIENEPYIPLVIERQINELYLTHYLSQDGDTFIDTEMVFQITPDGQLQFKETAVQDSIRGGESRYPDRVFARVFSGNILQQGFAQAAREQVQATPPPRMEAEPIKESSVQLPAETTQFRRQYLPTDVRNYLTIKDQHPDAVVLIKTADGLFYEAFFEDAEAIATTLDLILTSKQIDDPTVERVPLTGFPVHALDRFLQQLLQDSSVAVADGQGAIAHHPKQAPSLNPSNTQPARQPLPQPTLKELADQVRDTDLEVVAENLGLERDRHDKHKWRDAAHIISISNGKFMDWLADRGGGGAIDLVMHIQGVEFRQAVEWLSGANLTQIPRQAQTHPPQSPEPHSLEMPTPNEHRWTAVRQYLIETRKLPAVLIDRLHERGHIYADDYQNAVFVRHELEGDRWIRGEVTGASLRGTWGEHNTYHAMAPGSMRDRGWFWLGAGRGEIKRVLLTESPIDTLSLAKLDPHRQQTEGVSIYLSTDGSGSVPIAALQGVIERGGEVAIAFDTDAAGEMMSWRIAQELPGVHRLTPAYGKDWNERLVRDGHPEMVVHEEGQSFNKVMRSLWKWHRVAHELGKSENYVRRIAEVARSVVQGNALPERAKAAMLHDFEEVQRRLQDQRNQGGRAIAETAPAKLRTANLEQIELG
jgi:predicted RNA methylase